MCRDGRTRHTARPQLPGALAALLEAAGPRALADEQRRFLPDAFKRWNSLSIRKTAGQENGQQPGRFLSLVYAGCWYRDSQGGKACGFLGRVFVFVFFLIISENRKRHQHILGLSLLHL